MAKLKGEGKVNAFDILGEDEKSRLWHSRKFKLAVYMDKPTLCIGRGVCIPATLTYHWSINGQEERWEEIPYYIQNYIIDAVLEGGMICGRAPLNWILDMDAFYEEDDECR